jgi:hypothetical protein
MIKKIPKGKTFRIYLGEKADLMVNSTDSWFKPLPEYLALWRLN